MGVSREAMSLRALWFNHRRNMLKPWFWRKLWWGRTYLIADNVGWIGCLFVRHDPFACSDPGEPPEFCCRRCFYRVTEDGGRRA